MIDDDMHYLYCQQANLLKNATTIAEELALSVTDQTPDDLYLSLDEQGLHLQNQQTELQIDFLSQENERRRQSFGQKQPLAKAIGIKSKPNVLDATAGLARDAFLLASSGCEITLIEQSPILHCMIKAAMKQAQSIIPEIIEKMQLQAGDSLALMQTMTETFDVIYLDPMFPERRKSALVKKDMQLLQQLLGHNDNSHALLELALTKANKRVVLKRPRHAPLIQQPDFQILSKTHRYDVFTISQSTKADQ